MKFHDFCQIFKIIEKIKIYTDALSQKNVHWYFISWFKNNNNNKVVTT